MVEAFDSRRQQQPGGFGGAASVYYAMASQPPAPQAQQTRHYLGVKANKVRAVTPWCGDKRAGAASRAEGRAGAGARASAGRGSISSGTGMSSPGSDSGGAGAVETFLTSFEDSDLGMEGVALVELGAAGVSWAQSWACRGKVTCLEVQPPGAGAAGLEAWVGTALGEVCRIQVGAGADGGLGGDAMVADKDDFASAQAHQGVVASVDVNRQTGQVLSAGYDGRVCLHNAGSGAPGRCQLHHSTQGAASYSAVKWCSGDVFLTAGCGVDRFVGLQTWDRRSRADRAAGSFTVLGGRQQAEQGAPGSPMGAGAGEGGLILCADVHPFRPHVCATGHEGGLVALWDLRREDRPLQCTRLAMAAQPRPESLSSASPGGFGHVWEVRFAQPEALELFDMDPQECGASPVFACTQDGHFGVVTHQEGGHQAPTFRSLVKETSAVNSFDISSAASASAAEQGSAMVCVTGQEGLLHVAESGHHHHPLAGAGAEALV